MLRSWFKIKKEPPRCPAALVSEWGETKKDIKFIKTLLMIKRETQHTWSLARLLLSLAVSEHFNPLCVFARAGVTSCVADILIAPD